MTKRIFSAFLLLICILSFSTIPSRAEEADYQAAEIIVDSFGFKYTEKVLIDENNTIFAPISWFQKYGWLESTEESNQYVFYYPGEKTIKPFSKRIYIDMNGREASCVCYVTETKHKTYMTHEFTQSTICNNTLYLPVVEMLPLFNAKIEITDDGVLHINANTISVFSALYGLNLQELAFDADRDIWGHGFMTATGMLFDSILNLRVDRLDGLYNSGEITDYKKLFKAYLVDDEAFLSAYDEEKTPAEELMEINRNALKGTKEFLKNGKFLPDLLEYTFDSELYQGFKDFKDIYSGISDAVEGIYKIADYSSTYINQVDDHVKMLKAVYNTEFFGEGNPAYKAAVTIISSYGTDSAKQRKEIVFSALYDYAYKKFKTAAIKELGVTPYKIAFNAVKLAIPEAVEIIGDAAQLGYMDDVVDNACRVFDKRTQNMQFDAESLDELRLAAMLALVASRHAYNTYWNKDEMIEEKKKTSDALSSLYLAAESVECESAEHYNAMLSKLNSSISTLEVKATGTVTSTLWKTAEELVAEHRYWIWIVGVTGADLYYVELHEDNSARLICDSAISYVDKKVIGGYEEPVEWYYADGVLTICGIDYYWNGEEFLTEELYEMQSPTIQRPLLFSPVENAEEYAEYFRYVYSDTTSAPTSVPATPTPQDEETGVNVLSSEERAWFDSNFPYEDSGFISVSGDEFIFPYGDFRGYIFPETAQFYSDTQGIVLARVMEEVEIFESQYASSYVKGLKVGDTIQLDEFDPIEIQSIDWQNGNCVLNDFYVLLEKSEDTFVYRMSRMRLCEYEGRGILTWIAIGNDTHFAAGEGSNFDAKNDSFKRYIETYDGREVTFSIWDDRCTWMYESGLT